MAYIPDCSSAYVDRVGFTSAGLAFTQDNCANDLELGSRYIYELYYEKEAISKQLYDYLLKNNYADANLIAKWKKQGYEKVSIYYGPFDFGRSLRLPEHETY